jgi:hypothetical protein
MLFQHYSYIKKCQKPQQTYPQHFSIAHHKTKYSLYSLIYSSNTYVHFINFIHWLNLAFYFSFFQCTTANLSLNFDIKTITFINFITYDCSVSNFFCIYIQINVWIYFIFDEKKPPKRWF